MGTSEIRREWKRVMFWIIENQVQILIWTMEFLAVLFCIHGIFGEKFRVNVMSMILLVINFLVYSSILEGILPIFFSIANYFFIFMYCVRKFKKKISVTFFFYMGSIISVALIEIIATYLMIFFEKQIFNENGILLFLNGITLILSIIFYQFVSFKEKIRYFLEERGNFVIILICGFAIIFMFVDYRYRGKLDRIYYLVFLGLVISVVSFYVKAQKTRFQLEKKELELKMQEVYGKAYEELIFEVRRRQHDFMNQLGAIYSMHITATSLEELIEQQQKYGNSLLKENRYNKILTGCSNPILAGYLYSKCASFENQDVEVEYCIRVNNINYSLSLHEIVEALGILLNNAFESVMEKERENKRIDLVVEETFQSLNIQVGNIAPYLTGEEIEKLFHPGHSSKGCHRGIGLSRLKQLVEKCGADIIVENRKREQKNWIYFQIVLKSGK